ncbi:MAG: DNA repair protein RecN [Chloroflexaceae bacterium]|nr:DNA repair protein RecN [Chloroflexaceae bacterium]
MLLELQITDFAIIEHLHLHFDHGLTVLTGETGAGKSIIIDALGILRGDKADATLVRAGCSRARIEGVFSLHDCADLPALLQSYDLWDEEDEQVVLTRDISAGSGRSVARINQRAVNTSVLRAVGSRLVEIHGQHEGLSLFNPRTHIDLLDRYGNLLDMREQLAAQVDAWQHAREELATLQANEARRHERIEELRFLCEDVEAAGLRPHEEQELNQERHVLQNAARITELINQAYAGLAQGDAQGHYHMPSLVDLLGGVVADLNELARLDEHASGLLDQINEIHYQLEDLTSSVRAYRDQLDFEPGRLDAIEERLTLIRTMKRKYGGEIEQILEQAAQASAEIERLGQHAEQLLQLQQQAQRLLKEVGQSASELSWRRRTTGTALSQAIEQTMGELAMPHVRFAVQTTYQQDAQGVPVVLHQGEPPAQGNVTAINAEVTYLACDRQGIDRIEFLITPNPGEPLKPLARIASGGENARLLLALKSILSRVDPVPTMVFDEVDAGVGARAGQVVGLKLWGMTDGHQVLCITHLPQVAAFADVHYGISKEVTQQEQDDSITLRTRSKIQRLSQQEQIQELAAMLDSTVSEHTRASAQEILERASALKQQHAHAATTEGEAWEQNGRVTSFSS